jgi:hypothetical protein
LACQAEGKDCRFCTALQIDLDAVEHRHELNTWVALNVSGRGDAGLKRAAARCADFRDVDFSPKGLADAD